MRYINVTNQKKEVKDILREKLAKVSKNHYLESFIDTPNSVKEVFRISRIFYKEMQNLILVGQPGSGSLEYL